MVAVFAALIATFALTPAIPIGIGVPITLQTLAVILAGLVLGPWRGFLATGLYLAIGFAGLPVFAGGMAGVAVLAQPSLGYLLSFPFGAAVAGAVAAAFRARPGRTQYLGFLLAGIAGSAVIHAGGVIGLVLVAHMGWWEALVLDLTFWPGDLLKMAAAAGIAVAVQRAFPQLVGTRRTGSESH